MADAADPVEKIVETVAKSRRYRNVDRQIIRRVVEEEHRGGRKPAEVTKAAKKRLHRIYGAYLPSPPRYDKILDAIRTADDPREALRWAMSHHASTRERVPQLDAFYSALSKRVGTPARILDLACGMNPLAAPWMPLGPDGALFAFDIDAEMAGFLGAALTTLGVAHQTGVVDLEQDFAVPAADLALLLKTAPCLDIALEGLLPKIPAPLVVVSFPTRSLGRRSKGMGANYSRQLTAALAACGWQAEDSFEVPGELVYLLRGPDRG